MVSEDVYKELGWEPVTLQSKEGLALLNGTQFMSAYGANVLAFAGKVICSSAYPRTNAMLNEHGYDLIEVDLSEVHKMEAAVTCPSLILRG